jgi:broad specificity phosphatase PhoE
VPSLSAERPCSGELLYSFLTVAVITSYSVATYVTFFIRCLYAYFTGAEQSKIPSLRFKPHHIYELTPGPFGCTAREINPCVEY